MYNFHYNFINKYFDDELLFTDTDSFTYEIKSEDVLTIFLSTNTNICSISVTIQKIKRFLISLIKKLLVK